MDNLSKLYDNIYKRYRTVNSILSIGLDSYWRKQLIKELKKINPSPKKICDICSGTGDLTELLAENFKKSHIIAIDANEKMLEIATQKIHYKNVEFIKSDIRKIPFDDNTFDCVTISFATRNIYFSSKFDKIIKEIKRILKTNGVFIGVDVITHPNKIINLFSKTYIEIAIFLINFINPSYTSSYNFLKNSIFSFKLKNFEKIITENFGNFKIKRILPGNILIHISRKLT